MTKTIDDIVVLDTSLAEFRKLDYGMDEADWRAASGKAGGYVAGLWEGRPGEVDFPEMPYDEACWIIAGRIALVDARGGRREFGAGQGYLLPKGFAGRWVTIEDAKKFYVVLE